MASMACGMTSLQQSITRNLLYCLSGDAAPSSQSDIDRLDATLLNRIDWVCKDPAWNASVQVAASQRAIGQMFSYPIKRYQSSLLKLLQGEVEFITRQASNIVAARVSGAVNYAGAMRSQREVLLTHYNAKFGSAYHFAVAITLPVSVLTGSLQKAIMLLRGAPNPLVHPFALIGHSELRMVMTALRGESIHAFPLDMFRYASNGCLELNMAVLEKRTADHLDSMPAPILAELYERIERERSQVAYAPRPLDTVLLESLFLAVDAAML